MNVGVFATVQIVGEITLDFFPKRFSVLHWLPDVLPLK